MRYLVTINGKQMEVNVDLLDGAAPVSAPAAGYAPAAYAPPVPGPVYTAAPVQPQAAYPAAQAQPPAATDEQVVSPMPGNIWEVQVTVGQQVTAGQSLVILEAMKMENEIVAPRGGIVKQILVSKGAAVDTNDVLVVLS